VHEEEHRLRVGDARLGQERQPTRDQFEEAHPERKKIRGRARRLALEQLRRVVGGRPRLRGPRGGEPPLAGAVPRQAEVEDLDLPRPGHEEVRRLEVAVDDAVVVRVRHPQRGLEDDPAGRLHAQRAHPLRGALSAEQLHHHEEQAAFFPDVLHPEDVGVLQRLQELRLAQEAGAELRVGPELRADELHRPLEPAHLHVLRAPDLPHPARADPLEQPEAAELQAWRNAKTHRVC
jgi:hypothetical protein